MKKNFTLIELLVVVAIIGILASILMPSLEKSRRTAQLAVCTSNQKQINISNAMFLLDSDGFFINKDDVTNLVHPNVGYQYAGNGGSDGGNVVRPLNKYLGVDDLTQKIPVALCPSVKTSNPPQFVTKWNTSYMGTARGDQNDDLDGITADSERISQGAIIDSAKMVLISSSGGYHYARWGITQWSVDNHGERKYPMSFVDGHGKAVKIFQSMGFNSRDQITYKNVE